MYIITSITTFLIRLKILAIMSVSSFITAVILYICISFSNHACVHVDIALTGEAQHHVKTFRTVLVMI